MFFCRENERGKQEKKTFEQTVWRRAESVFTNVWDKEEAIELFIKVKELNAALQHAKTFFFSLLRRKQQVRKGRCVFKYGIH